MNEHTPHSIRTSGLRWLLALLLGVGLLALTPARADAAPLTGATQLDGLSATTCVVTADHQARCWGEGSEGQIGVDAFFDASTAQTVRDIDGEGPLTGVSRISAGGTHVCAVLQTGKAVCWGDDSHGQLGNGPTAVDAQTPVFVRNGANTAPLSGVADISVGGGFTCARLTSGQARCWGADSEGALGDGGPFSFGEQLPQTVVSTTGEGVLTGITQLTTGNDHACARLNTGQARCWGVGNSGQIGDGDNDNEGFPVVVKNGGGVAPLEDISQIAAGGSHTCARLGNGQARCWGHGTLGQLGNNDDLDRPRPVVVRAPAGTGALHDVTQIALGFDHTCFRISNGQVRCTGDGVQGQLGNPNTGNGPALRPVVVRNGNDTGPLANVAQITAGNNTTCARVTGGQVRCWGDDLSQQLGNGAAGNSDLPSVVQLGG